MEEALSPSALREAEQCAQEANGGWKSDAAPPQDDINQLQRPGPTTLQFDRS
jgi:hypothetical protein